MTAVAMTGFGRMCGWTLVRAHARTRDRIAIAAYLSESDTFDQAVAAYAETYADQMERDHAALAAAVASRRVQAKGASDRPVNAMIAAEMTTKSGTPQAAKPSPDGYSTVVGLRAFTRADWSGDLRQGRAQLA